MPEHVYAQKCLHCDYEFCTAGMLPCPLCKRSDCLKVLPSRWVGR